MAYTSNTLIGNFLGRSLTANEQALTVILIPAIQLWLDKKIGSTFDSASETTRYYDGGWKHIDIDPCYDITAIKSLNDDGTDSYTYNPTSADRYEVIAEPLNSTIKTMLTHRGGRFPRGTRRIAVTAKFSSSSDGAVPNDIQLAATRIAADVLSQGELASNANVASEALEGHTVTYKNANEIIDKVALDDPFVQGIISSYTDEILVD